MSRPAEQSVPRCPRCGYDQSGACPAWTNECPLEGTCPECGLQFEWADAFNPQRKRLKWLFEHKRTWSPGLLRAWANWLATIVPPRFWRRVHLEHNSTNVVLLWPVALFTPVLALVGLYRTAYLWNSGYKSNPIPIMTGNTVTGWTYPTGAAAYFDLFRLAWLKPFGREYWGQLSLEWHDVREGIAAPLGVAASACAVAGTLMMLTTSRRISGVRWMHVRRAAVYRLAPLMFLYLLYWLSELEMLPRATSYPFRTTAADLWFAVAALGLIAWGFWWWRSTLLVGWRMPRATTAATLLGLIDALTTTTVFTLLSPFAMGAVFG